jgi:hypothetical protein
MWFGCYFDCLMTQGTSIHPWGAIVPFIAPRSCHTAPVGKMNPAFPVPVATDGYG